MWCANQQLSECVSADHTCVCVIGNSSVLAVEESNGLREENVKQ